MRKYTTYRRSAPTSRRRATVRRGNAFSFFKFIFLCLLLCGLGVGAYFGVHKGYDAFMQSGRGNWHVKDVSVKGVTGLVQKEITAQVQPYQGKPFSVKDAYRLRTELVQKYPMLKDISVKRGLVTGTLKVSAALREPVAQFKMPDDTIRYVDKDSTVYADPHFPLSSQIPSVELIGKVPEKLRPDFVELVQSTLKLNKWLAFERLQMNLNDDTVTMVLPDQTVLNFGAPEQLKQKAQRAGQILEFARAHYPGPYQLNFRFFDQGKVFLTHKPN